MGLHAATSNQCDSWWLNLIFRSSTFGLISPAGITGCGKTLPLFTSKQKSRAFAISIETFFFFCGKTSQRHRQLSCKIYASSLCTETCCTSLFCFYVWLFSSLASDFISFLRLLNLIVKLDVLQISQPAPSSLSAWAASQINRRKWIIRCDY